MAAPEKGNVIRRRRNSDKTKVIVLGAKHLRSRLSDNILLWMALLCSPVQLQETLELSLTRTCHFFISNRFLGLLSFTVQHCPDKKHPVFG